MNIKNKEKKWSLQYCPGNEETDAAILKLAEEARLSAVMARILYTRGYQTVEAVESFLHLGSTSLHDPYLMRDVSGAVTRIAQAIERGERIAVYGDYDVDGVTAVSLMYLYLREYGADVEYYIPSRIREGYGLSKGAIDLLKSHGVSLMITVDTGITAIDEIAYAASLGIETVVTDHHECRDVLPDAIAVVNPHRPDDDYPFGELAGVGVVFKLICAYEMAECRKNGHSEKVGVGRVCREYADLVAIGTIADVMPIIDENRLIVMLGLSMLENTERPGLRALINSITAGKGYDSKNVKRRKINSSFVGFTIAPRMNAAGRVSDASIAVELLLCEDEEEASELAEQLCELNLMRQKEENQIADEAYWMIDHNVDLDKDRVIVLANDDWQQGIIGIVSSRITDRYGLPSILISFDGSTNGVRLGTDIGKGSGRSIKGMNLVEALIDSEDLLVRFGGHELAAGLSIRRCNVDAFRERINQYANEHLSEDDFCVSLDADCEVEMSDLSMRLAQEIALLEPFGIANPVPNLVMRDLQILRMVPTGGGKHTRMVLSKDGVEMTAVRFGENVEHMSVKEGDLVDVLFQLNVNEFQNVTSLQMIVQDIRYADSFVKECRVQKARYEEIKNGAMFTEKENIIPSRDDMVVIYNLIRKSCRTGYGIFSVEKMLMMLRNMGQIPIGYAKLKFIIRIMQELRICHVFEVIDDHYEFEIEYRASKTSIEKSSILHKLKMQLSREG